MVQARTAGSTQAVGLPLGAARTVRPVDPGQCRREASQQNLACGSNLALRRAMLVHRFKSAVAGLVFGLALLAASAPAVAHGQHRDGHAAAVAHVSGVQFDLTLSLACQNALPGRVVSKETTPRAAPVPRSGASFPQGSNAELRSSAVPNSSCGHAEGCHCCGANGGCCGMSCSGMALLVSVPILPHADGRVFATPLSAFLDGANADTLLRPPRPQA